MNNTGTGTWIHRRRIKSAGDVALIAGEYSLSYDVLAERIDRLANALAARGVQRGGRVAYLGENHPSFLETFFAVGTLGAVFVPINTRLAPPEVAFVLGDSGATILIHSSELAHLTVHGSADTPVPKKIVVGGGGDEGVEHFDAVIEAATAEHLDLNVRLTDPAMIMYTSGTTGQPKGALLSHQNIAWNSANVLVDYDVTSTTVGLMISPMFHVASLGMGVLPVLLKGGTLVLETHFDPGRALELIELHQVTSLSGVPTTYQMIAEHPAWPDADLSSVRIVTCGGSAVPLRVIDAYEARGLSFTGGYGLTETAPAASSLAPRYSRSKAGSAGLPSFFTDVRIASSTGEVLRRGEVGEIQIQGPNVISEYWHRPDATADAFADGNWFRSGDIGYFDDDGFLYISDRLKDMIISGGENIYPAEVEQAILELEAVRSVAVVGVPDDRWGEVPRAYIEVRDGFSITVDQVKDHLIGRLAKYKIPKTVVTVVELPRTSSGKIKKRELKDN